MINSGIDENKIFSCRISDEFNDNEANDLLQSFPENLFNHKDFLINKSVQNDAQYLEFTSVIISALMGWVHEPLKIDLVSTTSIKEQEGQIFFKKSSEKMPLVQPETDQDEKNCAACCTLF